jgi:CBS domain-containing protein
MTIARTIEEGSLRSVSVGIGFQKGDLRPSTNADSFRSRSSAHTFHASNWGDAAMVVESILQRKGTEVATIAPEASIKRAADWLRAKNVGALLVTSNDAILGIISERDIVRAFSHYGEPFASMQVKDIMTHGLITASPGDDLTHVMRLMTRHRVRHMPVLRSGKLAGMISIGDVVKHRLGDLELEASVLRDVYIASH